MLPLKYHPLPVNPGLFISFSSQLSPYKNNGVCNNCLRLKATELSADEYNNISVLVLTALSKSALMVDELLLHLPALKKEKVWKVINFLQAEGKLRLDEMGRLGARTFL